MKLLIVIASVAASAAMAVYAARAVRKDEWEAVMKELK